MHIKDINKCLIKIIYYDKSDNISIYQFNVNPDMNMQSIMHMIKKYLECQCLAINNCFGTDIAEIIKKYLPNMLEYNEIYNNNIYVNARMYNCLNFDMQHLVVPNNCSINNLRNKLDLWGQPFTSPYSIVRFSTNKKARLCEIIDIPFSKWV